MRCVDTETLRLGGVFTLKASPTNNITHARCSQSLAHHTPNRLVHNYRSQSFYFEGKLEEVCGCSNLHAAFSLNTPLRLQQKQEQRSHSSCWGFKQAFTSSIWCKTPIWCSTVKACGGQNNDATNAHAMFVYSEVCRVTTSVLFLQWF